MGFCENRSLRPAAMQPRCLLTAYTHGLVRKKKVWAGPGSGNDRHADRLRHPSGTAKQCGFAFLSRRSLEKSRSRLAASMASTCRAICRACRFQAVLIGVAAQRSPAAVSRCCSRRQSTGLALRSPFANCLYGTHAVYDPYLATAFAKATNDWIAAEWMAKDKRLRASIVVPLQAP